MLLEIHQNLHTINHLKLSKLFIHTTLGDIGIN